MKRKEGGKGERKQTREGKLKKKDNDKKEPSKPVSRAR